jgi:hypothetical protein
VCRAGIIIGVLVVTLRSVETVLDNFEQDINARIVQAIDLMGSAADAMSQTVVLWALSHLAGAGFEDGVGLVPQSCLGEVYGVKDGGEVVVEHAQGLPILQGGFKLRGVR